MLPLTHNQCIKGLVYYGPVKALFWLHVVTFVLLTIGGSWPVEAPFVFLRTLLSLLYFSFFFLLGFFRRLWDSILF